MKLGAKICYIIAMICSIIATIVLAIFFASFMITTAEKLLETYTADPKPTIEDLKLVLTTCRVIFGIFVVVELLVSVFIGIALHKMKDEKYYCSNKVAIPVISIILGLSDIPLFVAGIFWLIDSKRKC